MNFTVCCPFLSDEIAAVRANWKTNSLAQRVGDAPEQRPIALDSTNVREPTQVFTVRRNKCWLHPKPTFEFIRVAHRCYTSFRRVGSIWVLAGGFVSKPHLGRHQSGQACQKEPVAQWPTTPHGWQL
jgi:hypothetical protein